MNLYSVKLGDLCKVKGGFAFKSKDFTTSGIPVIKIANIHQNDVVIDESTSYLDKSFADKYEDFIVKEGSLLIALSGATTGKFGIYKSEEKALLNQRVAMVVPNEEKTSTKFIYYCLKGLQQKIFDKALGAAQPNISPKEIEEFQVIFGDIEYQKKVVDILNLAETLVDKRKAQIKALSDLMQSLFLEMFNTNEENITKIKLKDLIIETKNGISRRGSDTNGEIVLRLREIKSNSIEYSEGINRISLSEKEKNNYQLIQDDIALVRVNGNPDYVGRCAVFNEIDEKVFFNDHIIRIRTSNDVIPLYLAYYLNSQYGKKEIRKYIKTSAGQYTISREGIEKVTIILPSIASQRKFANMFTAILKQETILKQGLIKYEEIFNSLMQKAFKGELFNR